MIKKSTAAIFFGVLAAYFFYSTPVDRSYGLPGRSDTESTTPLQIANPTKPDAAQFWAPDQDSADSEHTEIVLGLRVRKDRDCTVELKDYVTPAGEMFSAYSCTPHAPRALHPLSYYTDDTLGTMAYSDAKAAEVLGKRLIGADTPRAYELLIRAAALDGGNTEHLTWLAEQAFGTVAVSGKPQFSNLERQYELAALAVRLGAPPNKSSYLKNELLRYGADTERLDALDERAEELLRTMRDIQRTVFGEVTIGGQGDA